MAVYTPITDQEIEPEAPLTSILQHKLRDNPLAMFEGAVGAPRLQTNGIEDQAVTSSKLAPIDGSIIANNSIVRGKLKIGTGQVASVSTTTNSVRPSGAFQIGHEISAGSNSLPVTDTNGMGFIHGPSIARGAYVSSNGSPLSFYNSYHSVSFINSWLFLLTDKGTSNIVGRWYCNHHPSYGQSSFFEHPFIGIDTNIFDIFCINITKPDVDFSLKSQYPVGNTGYFDPSLNTFADISPFRSKRGIIDSFLDKFNVDFSSPLPWLTDLFPVGNPDFNLGMDFIYTEIPEPSMVTRVGYSLK